MEKNQPKSLYSEAPILRQAALGLLALIMGGLSLYLTDHYYSLLFPTTLGGTGLCDINEFFNCNITASSPFSNIFGIPISLFGLLFSAIILLGFVMPKKEIEGTNYFLAGINIIGCLVLFLYSLVGLGGLCPGCTLYYLTSACVFGMFYKFSDIKKLSPKVLGFYFLLAMITSGIALAHLENKKGQLNELAQSLIPQFEKIPDSAPFEFESDYRVASSTENFTDAPIQISKFSDYECPGCALMAKTLDLAAIKYKGLINIQYFFFPLDKACNPIMQRDLHLNSCEAAYLAACVPKEKFSEITSYLFEHQNLINHNWLKDLSVKYEVTECMEKKETQEKVLKYIKVGQTLGLTGTPTIIINGKKITRMIPTNQLYILLDYLKNKTK